MRKKILSEIILLLLIASISIGLYKLIYGINLRCDNYFDMLTFELRRTTIILEIIGIFFLPIHISLNMVRLFYYKFLKRYLTFEILIESVLLAGILFYKYLFLSSNSVVTAKEGWTIYPPLTGLSALDEHDPTKLQNEQNFLLVLITTILVGSFLVAYLTFRRRKITGA